jgi:hypothetical protein
MVNLLMAEIVLLKLFDLFLVISRCLLIFSDVSSFGNESLLAYSGIIRSKNLFGSEILSTFLNSALF